MVPSLERTEYMYELHGIAENIVIERCKHSEVRPNTHTGGGASHKEADGEQDAQPPKEPHTTLDSPPAPGDVPVEPVFHIAMTQEKTLQELPNQLDFDWTESTPPPAREDLHVDRTPEAALEADMDTFVQVSQIAQEAVLDAGLHDPQRTTTVPANGSVD